MELIEKDLMIKKIGVSNKWNPVTNNGMCEYIAGLPEIDEILGAQNFLKSKPIINFTKREMAWKYLYLSILSIIMP
jgi:hypothetical protein